MEGGVSKMCDRLIVTELYPYNSNSYTCMYTVTYTYQFGDIIRFVGKYEQRNELELLRAWQR